MDTYQLKKAQKTSVVKYHNDLNRIIMKGWTALDMNILFAVLSEIKEKNQEEYTLSLKDVKELAQYKRNSMKEWSDEVTNTGLKILSLTYLDRTEEKISIFNLFSRFEVHPKTEEISISLDSNWNYILNNLKSQFTKYDLTEFISIKSHYAKSLYRLFKQWKTIGEVIINIDKLKLHLGLPNNYRNNTLNERIIPKAIVELEPFFENLKVEKIIGSGKGNPVSGYRFTWKPEERVEYDPDKYKKEETKSVAKPKQKSSGLAQYPDDALVQRRYFNGLNIIALDETFERDKIGNIRYFGFDTDGNYISVTESDYNEPLITVLTDKVQVPKSAQVIIDELKEKEELENREWEKKLSDFFEHLDNLNN